MKIQKKLVALATLLTLPLTVNAGIVSSNCLFDPITFTDICEITTETQNFNLTGTSVFYNFDNFTGQSTTPDSSFDITGSLELITTVSNPGLLGNITTTISGSTTFGIGSSILYSATFSQDPFTGEVLLNSEGLTGLAWDIYTPTLWGLGLLPDGSIEFNTIQNDIMGNFPGFNPLDGVLTGDVGNIAVDVALTGTVVPVPAAVWLFGSGLIGLSGFARRKKG